MNIINKNHYHVDNDSNGDVVEEECNHIIGNSIAN